MRKIVLNKCYGGFSLSAKAVEKLTELGLDMSNPYDIDRTDQRLVDVVQKLGTKEASGRHAQLHIIVIPSYVTEWDIDEYDGIETVRQSHWYA
tara:strand:- start:291 stop:569 length:279 start_codon:yes stop_codon:yes gene_type:complete